MGTMVASDVYEGTRDAKVDDLAGIRHIIKPLEEAGILVRRTDEELLQALESFVVVEREGQIIACAALFPFFQDKCGEVAAIAVASDCRGQGQGDKLLVCLCRLHREESFLSRAAHAVPTHNAYSRLVRETRVPRMFNRGDTRD
ncbi:Acyl-CoA N-acyltransferase protein [Raphanus sativus]|nr:Acyl-CoA N-acyltransferase protein [Raphanus sativus]